MYQNLFSLDYIVNDEKKSVLMSVLNEDFSRMNRERIISSLRAFLSQIDDDAIFLIRDIFFLFFFSRKTRQITSPQNLTFLTLLYLNSWQKTHTHKKKTKKIKNEKSTHAQTEELLLVVVVFLTLRTVLF